LNVLIDAVIGIVPFVGDALDIAFKSNVRNLRLLEAHLARQQKRGGFNINLAPSYEEEFANRPPPRPASSTGASTGLGGMNLSTVMQLVNLFSMGGGGARSGR
jgi:hypothetical protein